MPTLHGKILFGEINHEEDNDNEIDHALNHICGDMAEGFSDGDIVDPSVLMTFSMRKKMSPKNKN